MPARQHRRLSCLVAAAVLVAPASVTPAPVSGQAVQLDGRTAGGAYYRIVVPEPWNGDLVIFANGIETDNVAPAPPLGELSESQLEAGFAVATSSYRTNLYSLFRSRADLRALQRLFEAEVGVPERLFIVGLSMGGLVAAEVLEKGLDGPISGALIYCGLLGGGPYLDMFMDLRLAYDVECGDVPGSALPGGAEGLPADSELTIAEVTARIDACTGVATRASANGGNHGSTAPSKAQLRRQKTLLEFSTIPNGDFLLTDLLIGVFATSDVLHDRRKLRGRQPYTNLGVTFPHRRIDRQILRVEADPKGRRKLMKHYTPTGKVRDGARILALHEALDGFVFVENLGDYASKVPVDQLAVAVAEDAAPSHCDFNSAELQAGWDELIAWVDGGVQPDAGDIQASCAALSSATPGIGPCRFADEFSLGRIADRVPAR